MAIANYTTIDANGLGAYLPDVDLTANATVLALLNSAASRFIDHITGQWFWNDGGSVKYFDQVGPDGRMEGGPQLNTMQPFFSLTSIQLAYFENQPLSQWLTLTGDGITPPSNYYLWPRNPRNAGIVGQPTALKPFWGIDLAHLPSPNTTFLPIYIGGYKTAAVTATWGWPGIPDVISDLTAKLVVRAWRAKEAGHPVSGGSSQLGGTINMAQHFDERDMELLVSSDLMALAI